MVVRGFHAAEVLRTGDRVLTFDGVPMRDRDHGVALIVARDPGDEVDLGVIRGGDAITVRVRLGRRDQLDQPALLDGPIVTEAWAIRCQAVTAPEREITVIDSGLTLAAWAPVAEPPAADAWASAGGEPRGGQGPDASAVFQGNVADIGRANPRVRIDARPGGLRRDPNQLMLERRAMQSLTAGLEQSIEQYQRQLMRADLPVQRRQDAQLQLEFARVQLVQARERIREIERDIARLGGAPNGGRGGP